MKILILGGSGFLGRYLSLQLSKNHDIYATFNKGNTQMEGIKYFHLDISDFISVKEIANSTRPDVIINCAGITKVTECDNNPEQAYEINCSAVFKLSRISCQLGIKLIHFSTDLVYNGEGSGYNSETDTVDPQSIYGKTKLISENIVTEFSSDYIVFRLALLYGKGSGRSASFIDWIQECIRENKPIPLYHDQFRSMLYVGDVSKAIEKVFNKNISGQILNLGGEERISRYDFGQKYLEIFYPDCNLALKSSLKKQLNYSKFGIDCSMNINKIKSMLDFKPSSILEGLKLMKLNYGRSE